jgi:cysteine-rich repeat protein
MHYTPSLRTKLLVAFGAIALIALIGINTDLIDLVRDREKDGKAVYTQNRIVINSAELSQGTSKADLLSLLIQEESDSELEDVIQALSGAEQQERELEIRLVSQDLIDDRKLNELLDFASELKSTGFEYQGKKYFQRITEQAPNVEQNIEPQLALLRELLSRENTVADDWGLFTEISRLVAEIFEKLKDRGALYTLSDSGVIQEVSAEANFETALSQSFPAVALVSPEFYTTIEPGSDLSGIRDLLQSSYIELRAREGSHLVFSLRREFIPEVDSRDFFISIGWRTDRRFKLVRLVPAYFSEAAFEDCGNGLDDDQDQLVDCDDSDCAEDTRCMHVDPELDCFDGEDNDGNGATDCEDQAYCQSLSECQPQTPVPTVEPTPYPTPETPSTETICDDWSDNDYDGMQDCSDPDCSGSWNCYWNPPLDCTNGATCSDGSYCIDGYDAGGWCYYPCNNCNYYQVPPPVPSITTPYYGQAIEDCEGVLTVSGYASDADYVEIFIDGISHGTTSGSGSWSYSLYLPEGEHSISAVSHNYSTGSSERSFEQPFSYYRYCQPPLSGAEFVDLSDGSNLTLNCDSNQVSIPVRVSDWLEQVVVSVNGIEVDSKQYLSNGEYEFQVELPANNISYLDLWSTAYGQSTSQSIWVNVQAAENCAKMEICNNKQDDDRDGLTDCKDADCKYDLTCRVISESALDSEISSLDPEFLISFSNPIKLTGLGTATLQSLTGEPHLLEPGKDISLTSDGLLLIQFFRAENRFARMLTPETSYRLVLDSLIKDDAGRVLNISPEGIRFNTPTESTSPERVLRHKFHVTQICGDDVKTDPEECDDGNILDGDGCTKECRLENTSTPTPNPTDSPTPIATATTAPTEAPTAGPSATPTDTYGGNTNCGDGTLDSGEECDNGTNNGVPGGNCTSDCKAIYCCRCAYQEYYELNGDYNERNSNDGATMKQCCLEDAELNRLKEEGRCQGNEIKLFPYHTTITMRDIQNTTVVEKSCPSIPAELTSSCSGEMMVSFHGHGNTGEGAACEKVVYDLCINTEGATGLTCKINSCVTASDIGQFRTSISNAAAALREQGLTVNISVTGNQAYTSFTSGLQCNSNQYRNPGPVTVKVTGTGNVTTTIPKCADTLGTGCKPKGKSISCDPTPEGQCAKPDQYESVVCCPDELLPSDDLLNWQKGTTCP